MRLWLGPPGSSIDSSNLPIVKALLSVAALASFVAEEVLKCVCVDGLNGRSRKCRHSQRKPPRPGQQIRWRRCRQATAGNGNKRGLASVFPSRHGSSPARKLYIFTYSLQYKAQLCMYILCVCAGSVHSHTIGGGDAAWHPAAFMHVFILLLFRIWIGFPVFSKFGVSHHQGSTLLYSTMHSTL